MSWEASSWAKSVSHHPDGTQLLAREKLLLMILADYHNSQLRYAWVGLARLASESLTSRQHVIRIIRNFEEHGGLVRVERAIPIQKGEKGKTRSQNRYFLGIDVARIEFGPGNTALLPPSDAKEPPVVTKTDGGSNKKAGLADAHPIEREKITNTNTNPPYPPASQVGKAPNEFDFECADGTVIVFVPIGRKLFRNREQQRFEARVAIGGDPVRGRDSGAVQMYFKLKGFRVEFRNLFAAKAAS